MPPAPVQAGADPHRAHPRRGPGGGPDRQTLRAGRLPLPGPGLLGGRPERELVGTQPASARAPLSRDPGKAAPRGARAPDSLSRHRHGRDSMTTGRTEAAKARRPGSREIGPRVLQLPAAITVGELAQKVGVSPVEVIKNLMRMGVMAGINQAIDLEVAKPIAQLYGYQVKQTEARAGPALGRKAESGTGENLVLRPPVVTVLGHVDHGKTSILDAIRKTNVAAGEAGGITQHIGAYQVEERGQRVTFLDTPGHEAFTSLRARGAHVTDIAVLVVAANDGVMPQTVEAISHIKAANVPIVVAINKMDLSEADPERVKRQLSELGVVVEDWGGDVVSVPVSAKSGQGITDLLEAILLVAEISELKADPTRPARGTVIEAKLHPSRGPMVTLLVQDGTLRTGDTITAGPTWGRVRAMTDSGGRRQAVAGPSTPVEVTGLPEVPRAGDTFEAAENEHTAREKAEAVRRATKATERRQPGGLEQVAAQIGAGETRDLNVIVKSDVHGSLEAIQASLERLGSDKGRVKVLHADVGSITEGDILLASASGAIILGFNARVEPAARRSAETQGVEIRIYSIIYQLLEDVEKALRGIAAPVIQEVQEGKAEVRQVFTLHRGTVAGCLVTEGRLRRGASARARRKGAVIYEGPIISLRHFKDEVREVVTGQECGIGLGEFADFAAGDVIETFRQEERPSA
ncbi:MAG: translation initiation factor IF-2 [Chloroflexi bacterium]|nr:translation initiation factor IF-2 [Chloroflexota bacterium]